MDTTTVAKTTMETVSAVVDHATFGELAGYALIILAVFAGITLLLYGWPHKDYE